LIIIIKLIQAYSNNHHSGKWKVVLTLFGPGFRTLPEPGEGVIFAHVITHDKHVPETSNLVRRYHA